MPPKIRQEYVCYYEGQQEELYYDHFSRLVKEKFENATIRFNKIENFNTLVKSSTALPKLAIFDYDNNKKEFENKARTKKIRSLYTSLNFDLWILLHKKDYTKSVTNNDDYVNEVRKAYKLGKTANIKRKDVMENILSQIQLEDIRQAIKRANKIMDTKLECDKKVISSSFCYYDNPSMNIQKFFEEKLEEITKK